MKTTIHSVVTLLFALLATMQAAESPILADPLLCMAPRFDVFQETPINAISPGGWLREFLVRQNNGLTGHHEVLSYPFDTCLWAGLIPPRTGHGKDWWPYEQTAYLSDGILRLGYLLGDESLLKTGSAGVEYVLAHPMKNGRLGHPFFESQWPMAVYFRVMEAEFQATRNPQLLEALRKHYLSYSVDDLVKGHRHIVNLEGMLWTYGQTGDPKLLDLAEKAYRTGGDEMPLARCASPNKVVTHGVTYMEEAKLPAILYSYTGKKEYLAAAVNAFKKLDRDHMLPDGVPSSNECLAGRDPLQSHETCDISDYTWSLGYLLMATGDAAWADRIEKAVFNAGPGAVSKDFKNLQYYSCVNQVIATGNSDHSKSDCGSERMAYWPCHETECCAGNVHRFMPNFAARMWMRTPNGGLAATLYGAATISIPLNHGGQKLTVSESTGYPFSDTVTFSFATARPVAMPFAFRLPGWCENPAVTINGKAYDGELVPGHFVTIKRTLNDGDKVVLRFPMTPKLVQWDNWGVTVERGPLLFAYAVPEKVTVDTKIYDSLRGKKSSDPVNFPALDIRPAGAWNYAIAAKAATELRVSENPTAGYPFDPASPPVVIQVPARKVKNWSLRENRFTPPLPQAGKFECDSETEIISLVPYGCTRLRLSVFPIAPAAGLAVPDAPTPPPVGAEAPAPQKSALFQNGDRWTVVGDSITHGGTYYTWVYLYYATRFPDRKIDLFNAGNSGDDAHGALKRYDWDIQPHKSTVATVMFGMNDVRREIYGDMPLTNQLRDQRAYILEGYRGFMTKLVKRLQSDGTKVILITPSIYDETAKSTALPLTGVNGALGECAAFMRKLAGETNSSVIDFHDSMGALNAKIQAKDPAVSLIKPDRVHPNPLGHFVMAYLFLKGQQAPAVVSNVSLDATGSKVLQSDNATIEKLAVLKNEVTFTLSEKALPYPVDKEQEPALAWVPFNDEFNREILKVSGLAPGEYQLSIDGKRVRLFKTEELETGINLALEKNTPQARQAAGVLELVKAWYKQVQEVRMTATFEFWNLGEVPHPVALETVREHVKADMARVAEQLKDAPTEKYKVDNYARYLKTKPCEADNIAKLGDIAVKIRAAARPQPHAYRLEPVNVKY